MPMTIRPSTGEYFAAPWPSANDQHSLYVDWKANIPTSVVPMDGKMHTVCVVRVGDRVEISVDGEPVYAGHIDQAPVV